MIGSSEKEATQVGTQILEKLLLDRVDSIVAMAALINAAIRLGVSLGFTGEQMKENILKWTNYE